MHALAGMALLSSSLIKGLELGRALETEQGNSRLIRLLSMNRRRIELLEYAAHGYNSDAAVTSEDPDFVYSVWNEP